MSGARSPRPRITDVAAAAGVSPTTVSQALNDVSGARIALETRDRIRAEAERLGYSPSRLARGLRMRRSHTIGMIGDQIATTPYAGQLILGAQQAALERGWWLLIANTDGDADVEEQAIKQMILHEVDGLLYATMYHRAVTLPALLAGIPTVLLDAESTAGDVPAVVPDEVAGGAAAVELLVAAGHRRIAFATNADDVPATRGRLAGYRQALRSGGIRLDRRLVVADESTIAGGHRAVLTLLDRPTRPTAVFCYNDRMAMGAYRAAAELGLEIPGDVSIVGFDDQQLISEGLSPGLTTIALPHLEMGRWAVEQLIELIVADEQGSRSRRRTARTPHLMPCPVVHRSSVGPPPGVARDGA